MSQLSDHRFPITLVTGFLGSGKTTVIRHLLAAPRFANAAIIVNEFGDVGIDHHLFRKTTDRITLLSGGCACCARRDDLVEALLDLIRRVDRGELVSLDHVIIETSGLADPAPILHTIAADPVLHRRFRVAETVATIDLLAGKRNLATYQEAVRQVTAADLVLLTKSDLSAAETATDLMAIVHRLNPAVTTARTQLGSFDLALLDHEPIALARNLQMGQGQASHEAAAVTSFLLEVPNQVDWPMLGLWLTMLLHRHGERVLRVKGILDVGADGPLLLEGVQHVMHAPRHVSTWPAGASAGTLVFIVRELDVDLIRASFTAFQDLAAAASR